MKSDPRTWICHQPVRVRAPRYKDCSCCNRPAVAKLEGGYYCGKHLEEALTRG